MLKSKRVLLLCLLMAGLGLLVFTVNRRSDRPLAAERSQVESWLRRPRSPEPRSAVSAPVPMVAPAVAAVIAAECQNQWATLNALDLQQYLDGSQSLPPMLALSEHCTGLPPRFTTPLEIFKHACEGPSAESEPARQQQRFGCYQAMVIFRAVIADFATPALTASEISDPRLLADKLIAGLFGEVSEGLPFAERLLEVQPGFAPAAKVAAVLQMVALDSRKPGGSAEKVQHALERAESLSENDAADSEFFAAVRLSADLAAAKTDRERIETARSFAEAEPGNPKATYMSSYVAFKEGRYSQASALLAEAIRADPTNADYQETQKELQAVLASGMANPRDQKIYSHSYSVDVSKLVP